MPQTVDLRANLRRKLGIRGPDELIRTQVGADPSVASVVRYHGGSYTGSGFERYGRNDPNELLGDDVVAITLLSIQIAEQNPSALGPSSILKLRDANSEIRLLLSEIPGDRDLHHLDGGEFDGLLGAGSAAEALYNLLRRRCGVPRVATHKLLARKRPRLIPIRDTVVESELGMSASPTWWRPWWEAVSTDDEIVTRLHSIRRSAEVRHLSLLRVADIVVWMGGVADRKATPASPQIDDTSGEP